MHKDGNLPLVNTSRYIVLILLALKKNFLKFYVVLKLLILWLVSQMKAASSGQQLETLEYFGYCILLF